MSEKRSILSRLSRMREEVVADVTHELLTNPRFAGALGSAVKRTVKTKKKANRNVGLVMSLSGIPSKADFDRLADRTMNLGKHFARLEEQIDELTLRLEKLTAQLPKS